MLNIGVNKMDKAEACFDFFGAVAEAKDKVGEGDSCGDGSSEVRKQANRFNHCSNLCDCGEKNEISIAEYFSIASMSRYALWLKDGGGKGRFSSCLSLI